VSAEPATNGRVERVSVKPRVRGEYGLPKPSVPRLEITPAGAVGDHNNYRTEKLPGDLDQAILVITRDLLDQLRVEGWPVEPGDLGENVTVTGVPESALAPGTRLHIGGVVLEISLACDPCTETYVLPYVGTERGPAFVRALTGRRGWYARVIQPGTIAPGDQVFIQSIPNS
jgi:MOSC domain-containing protein YiiM